MRSKTTVKAKKVAVVKGRVRLYKKLPKGKQIYMRLPLVSDEGEVIGEADIPLPPAGGWSALYGDPFGNPVWFPGIAGPRRFQKLNKDDGPDLVA